MSNLQNKKIVVTGGAGFLGSFVVEKLKMSGVREENIRIPRSAECDLRKQAQCEKIIKGQDIVIHLAAKVGGIGFNQKAPGELFYDNAIMGIQLMEAARKEAVEKFITVGTVCAYPKHTPVPFKEDDIWNGYPEETNAPYGLAKKMLLVQAQAYHAQYGMNAPYLIPVNLYGPRDNFDPESSHVIPALIRKIYEAQKEGHDHIDVWGTGRASREFIFVEDAAEGIVSAAERYNKPDPVNIGSGREISIKELVETLCTVMEFTGEVRWDGTKPDGQPRRMLDTSRAKEEFGFEARTSLNDGLKKTVTWYLENYG